jgi:hypothetical protein
VEFALRSPVSQTIRKVPLHPPFDFRQDIDAYATAWAGLKPKQRAAIGLECHEALKNIAATVDGDFTDMTGTNDGLAQAKEAA